ncbi:putative transcriptional regulator [Chryseobacterium soldanellicola]|uniref:Putative transcriptional regulator n=1 Tax=Chryseobacterium soldanellicola TaxID=311333 RepID=A0A1H0ZZZ8_9FLAO|nr:helix-turn-helix transcriptional regulator [Chryseobacterium soldanellicola]SDQ32950.1 putative transcriptional regulator [Chryseobacterium soldanellicola]
MVNIGSSIKKYRVENNISQEDMAYELNISQSKLSKIENGKLKISLILAITVFRQLSFTVTEILEILEKIS